jgi:hypothetical protein
VETYFERFKVTLMKRIESLPQTGMRGQGKWKSTELKTVLRNTRALGKQLNDSANP